MWFDFQQPLVGRSVAYETKIGCVADYISMEEVKNQYAGNPNQYAGNPNQYGGRHLISMREVKKLVCRKTLIHINKGNPLFVSESCICNKGNPLFARESKGNPPKGLIFDLVYYCESSLRLRMENKMLKKRPFWPVIKATATTFAAFVKIWLIFQLCFQLLVYDHSVNVLQRA